MMRNILFHLLLFATLIIGCRPYPDQSAEVEIIATVEEVDLTIASKATPDINITETPSPIPLEPNSTEILSLLFMPLISKISVSRAFPEGRSPV